MRRDTVHISAHLFVTLATITVTGYFLLALAQRTLQIYQLKVEEARLQEEVAGLQQRYEALITERDDLLQDTDIEKIAREELNLIKPGETAVVVIPSQEATVKAQSAEAPGLPGQAAKPASWPPWAQLLRWLLGP